MGKRKHSKDENYEYITRKLKKLEKKLKRAKKTRRDSTSSTSSSEQDDMLSEYPEMPSERKGDDPSIMKVYGKDVNADFAIRLQHIATVGLAKHLRKELQGKYLPPKNCTQIDAPELNAEMKAAVTDVVLKRDKEIEAKQKVLSSAISCLGEAITILLEDQNKNTAVIKLLMDATRLVCDYQNTDFVTSRNFILYNLKKEMKDQLTKTKRNDNCLFGSDLADTLKTAKSISMSSAELKITLASATCKQEAPSSRYTKG